MSNIVYGISNWVVKKSPSYWFLLNIAILSYDHKLSQIRLILDLLSNKVTILYRFFCSLILRCLTFWSKYRVAYELSFSQNNQFLIFWISLSYDGQTFPFCSDELDKIRGLWFTVWFILKNPYVPQIIFKRRKNLEIWKLLGLGIEVSGRYSSQ